MKQFLNFLLLVVLIGSFTQASETVKGAKKDIETFKQEMAVKLDAVEKELVDLRQKAKVKGSATRDQVIADLEKTRDELKAQLAKVDESASSNWKKFKKNFAESMDSLNAKIQKALKD